MKDTQKSLRDLGRDDRTAPHHGDALTPGRYVGAEEVEDDEVPFAETMEGLTRESATQFHESEKPRAAIRDNMQKLGFALPVVGECQRHKRRELLFGTCPLEKLRRTAI